MRNIVIGHLPLPSAELAAALIQCVLERLAHRVELVEGSAPELLERFSGARIDMISSEALQFAGPEWESVRRGLVEIASLADGHRYLWSIPDTTALRGVRTIAELADAPVRREVATVRGGPTAAKSREALRAYGLEAAGFRLHEDTLAHWRELCRGAKDFVIAHPSHHRLPEECDFRPLEDPLRALGGEFRTSIVARADVSHALPPRTREVLGRVRPGTAALTEMESRMRRSHAAPRALVRDHLDASPHVWNDWLGADPAVPAR